MDTNNDGVLDKLECTILANNFGLGQLEGVDMFESLDYNNNGAIEFSELLSAWNQPINKYIENIELIFDEMGQRNGKVDLESFQKFFEK